MKIDDYNITLSPTLDSSIKYTVIPILYTQLKTHTLSHLLAKHIDISSKYYSILQHINANLKNNNVSLATLTIELEPLSKQSKTRKASGKASDKTSITATRKHNTVGNSKKHIHQIYFVLIDDKHFQKKNNNEIYEALRISGSMIYSLIKNNFITHINILYIVPNQFHNVLLEGLLLSSYKFDKYKTTKALNSKSRKYHLQHIHLALPNQHLLDKLNTEKSLTTESLTTQIKQQTTIVKSVFLARDLVNEPANNSRSTRFLNEIQKNISSNKLPITLEILDKPALEKLGMGLLLAVGKGSSPQNAPKLAILKYTPNHEGNKQQTPEYILLGKGITFDTGGMDLKRPGGMIEMKSDLSGAASVMAFLLGYSQLRGSKCIYAICPFAENSIGPSAIKPSDVVIAYDKRTVEITDTDAEGRLVLADCLAYAVDKYPNAKLIDFATLTGEQERVSGKMFSCMLGSNSDKEMEKIILAGDKINEPLVKMPILDKQITKLESYVADIKNVNFTSQADIIMSTLFMKQFIKKTTRWIHIDIAGPSYKLNDVVKYASPEASGIGVRLLFEYFC
jgi:leucyl aminopeptidase